MKNRYFFFMLLSFFLVSPVFASSWPATDSVGTNIGSALLATESTFEPSGIIWHEGRNQFIAVGGQGLIATLSLDGSTVSTWDIGTSYDLEGVTIVDTTSSYVYLLDENLAAALEFDLDTGELTGRSWSFIDYVPEVNRAGAEGIAWVANDEQSFGVGTSGGLFYIGWQYDGDIYVFNPDLSTTDSVSFVVEIHMTTGYTDLADLAYSKQTDTLYASYAGLGLIEERTADGIFIASYSMPGSDQEGVAVIPSCSTGTATIVFGEDYSQQIISYSGYPITCASVDVEEAAADFSIDCNDIEISGDSVDNDCDGIVDENNTIIENGAHPYYSTLDPYDIAVKATSIISISGTTNGGIVVTFADNSVYFYDAIFLTTDATTKARSVVGTVYIVASLGKYGTIVNGYTGDIVATTTFQRGYNHPYQWARAMLGI